MTKVLTNLVSRFGKKKVKIGVIAITSLLLILFAFTLYLAILNHMAFQNYTNVTM
ncbi:hypothetical protein [Latilactobacillus fuchuensis]|uniref:Uncharacterized protein n=1 Tax=Latilactobacillus fuchuensis DSM 14340 = JCM 11249 TaxID=1423747 RepID=A0A0R1RQC2_9LACO|nr:hypothetical protein [Latilactobacillus fuchuensis]KRL59164.1 hypothetical protein FC69_GL001790 [Latilactobacillus fuchuensis DSM 14340 = JCM 11249]